MVTTTIEGAVDLLLDFVIQLKKVCQISSTFGGTFIFSSNCFRLKLTLQQKLSTIYFRRSRIQQNS